MVRTAVEDYGFWGIKVHRHDARISREVCEAARAFGLPVLYDVENELPIVDVLARAFPDVAFIIPHLGSFGENWRAQTAFLDKLERYPNIHADSSGVRFSIFWKERCTGGRPQAAVRQRRALAASRLEKIAKIRALALPRAEEQLILGGNFLRLVGWGEASMTA